MLPTVPRDTGDAVNRTILTHRNRVHQSGAPAVAEENRAVIRVFRGRNIVSYQVQIIHPLRRSSRGRSRWRGKHPDALSILHDPAFSQVIKSVAVRPKSEAEIAEMENIVHAASLGRFRRKTLEHIHVLCPRVEPE